jgi:hypothetical protein
MVVVTPLSLLGQSPSQNPPQESSQAPSAILHTQGGVWVNGSEARDSTAIFAGDLVETKPGFSATLNLDGSEVLLAPEAIAKFGGDVLALDHGSVSVGTSKSFKVQVKCLTVEPLSSAWTQYEVSDLTGSVQVVAHKNDVNVEVGGGGKAAAGAAGGTLHEGQQKSYDESALCGTEKPTSTARAVNPKWIAAGAAGAGILIWVLIHSTGGKPPVSQDSP